MPVSRTVPYMQSPWHPPATTQSTFTQLSPHTTVSTQPGTATQFYTEQQIIQVPVVKTRLVRRPITLWRDEEVVEDDSDKTAAEEKTNGTEHKAAEQTSLPLTPLSIDGSGSKGGYEEKQNNDVVLDIDDDTPDSSAAPLSSTLFSLVQPLTSFPTTLSNSASTSAASSSTPSAASMLSRYNPRIINGYLDRRRPPSRKLLAVPNELLPPPPFVPPSYPLSTRDAATVTPHRSSASSDTLTRVANGSTAGTLTIDLSSIDASNSVSASSSSAFHSHLPPQPSTASPTAQWYDPTSLVGCGLVLRDNTLLPRGSPRHLSTGCAVYDVADGSRAWQAGVRSGDAIVSVEGREVRNEEECVRWVNRVCGKVKLVVRRDGELVELIM